MKIAYKDLIQKKSEIFKKVWNWYLAIASYQWVWATIRKLFFGYIRIYSDIFEDFLVYCYFSTEPQLHFSLFQDCFVFCICYTSTGNWKVLYYSPNKNVSVKSTFFLLGYIRNTSHCTSSKQMAPVRVKN